MADFCQKLLPQKQGGRQDFQSEGALFNDDVIDGIAHASVVVTFGKNRPFFRQ